jgi:hypothetical protein
MNHRSTHIFSPFSDTRLWITLLWSVLLSVILMVYRVSESVFRQKARGSQVILLPNQDPDEHEREAEAARLGAEPGVRYVSWVQPAEVARQIEIAFQDVPDGELEPPEESWIPWMLEIRMSEPLDHIDRTRDFILKRRQEALWTVITDSESMDSLRRARSGIRKILITLLILILPGGLFGLKCIPCNTGYGGMMRLWSGLLVLAFLLAGWHVMQDSIIFQLHLSGLAWGLAGGFILATLIAPMIRKKTSGSGREISQSEGSNE